MKRSTFFTKRTKIVCTIGPATGSAAVIEQLIKAGMNIARFNLSHGTYSGHARNVRTVRRLSQRLAIPVAILIDLPGPKYRTGKLKDGRATLNKGAQVVLTTRQIEGDNKVIPVNLPTLSQDAKVGDTILLDDGAIKFKVLAKQGADVSCRVMIGGILTDGRGLVVPGMRISGPFITDTVRECIAFAIKQQPDYVALSFVSKARDLAAARDLLRESGADIPIIAKIERGVAVENFDSILVASDGIMVARGDLGVDIPLESVPIVQKEIVKKCNKAGKPVITATQMLESMVSAPQPTRAEVTDIANAIFDGTDAMMLSEETSIGKYPVQAVKTMAKVAGTTEGELPYKQILLERAEWSENKTDELISYSACYTAHSLGAVALVAFTQSGSTAGRVSRYRPRIPILAISPSNVVVGRLLLRWGVYPFQIEGASSVEDLFATGTRLSEELGLAKTGDLIVITGGIPVGVAGSTNLLKVEQVE
ncbi:MAG: pyruvate kinase [Dehalococcoidia bacterium]|jgi:pyruvate kinase